MYSMDALLNNLHQILSDLERPPEIAKCGRLNNVPQNVCALISRHYVTLHGKRDFAGVTRLSVLKSGD